MKNAGHSVASLDVLYGDAPEGKQDCMDLLSDAGFSILAQITCKISTLAFLCAKTIPWLLVDIQHAVNPKFRDQRICVKPKACTSLHTQRRNGQLYGVVWALLLKLRGHKLWHTWQIAAISFGKRFKCSDSSDP